MNIYLKHPVHGAKVAMNAFELEDDIANGWEVFDPNETEVKEEEAPKRRPRRAAKDKGE